MDHDYQNGICSMCGSAESSLLPGDADGDGTVTYLDAMMVLRCAVGLVSLSEDIQKACDVNLDGFLDYMDAMTILRYSVGLVPALPVTK